MRSTDEMSFVCLKEVSLCPRPLSYGTEFSNFFFFLHALSFLNDEESGIGYKEVSLYAFTRNIKT